ncbi:MAG: SEC-C metal-binding domain-containing protein [Dorea longicatena]
MDYLSAAKMRYYSKDNSENIIKNLNKKLSANISACKHEFLCLFNDILSNTPCCYWNKDIYDQTLQQSQSLLRENPDIVVNEAMMEYFLIGYNTYTQVTSIINDLSGLNDNPLIKNRQYRIPTYVSIVEGCLTNLFRFIVLLLNQASDKDYSTAHKLKPLCDILNKNGYDKLVANININIRNAINHGGIIFSEDGRILEFHYMENHQSVSQKLNIYEFDHLIEYVYDTASAIILAISILLNNNWNALSINLSERTFVTFALFSMKLSIPSNRCQFVYEIPDKKQLNLDFIIENSDRTNILQTAIELSMIAYSKFNDYKQYFLSFSNERLQTSWIRFTNQEILDMILEKRNLSEVASAAMERRDVIIFNPSTGKIDLQEIKYFRFPNYEESSFRINHIEDASLPDMKRLKCHLFIGEITNKQDILDIICKAINWLKNLKNVDSPTLHHKNGNMEADSIYINVYRHDARQNKELFLSNCNFVCFVDYNMSGNTTLIHGGLPLIIWEQLHHEKIGKIDIAWREGKYTTRIVKKIGVNSPCPCGSGKKFKKCCKGKGFFD